MTLIELFNAFGDASDGLGAAEKGLYMTLLHIWNALHRPDFFDVSNTDLQNRLGTGSHHSVIKWRDNLERGGFIQTESLGRTRPIRYRLTDITRAENAVVEKSTRAKNAVDKGKKCRSARAENAVVEKSTRAKNAVDKGKKCRSQVPDMAENKAGRVPPERGIYIYTNNKQENTEDRERERKDNNLLRDTGATPGNKSPLSPPPEKILNLYQTKIRPVCSKDEMTDLATLCEEYGTRRVSEAIDRATEREKRSLGYIRGILRNWTAADDERGNAYDKRQRRINRPARKLTAEEERAKWDEAERRQREWEQSHGGRP